MPEWLPRMNSFKQIWKKTRSHWKRREVKREIDEELRFHIEQRTAESPADPIVMSGAVLLLFAVALTACFVPGLRATRINPSEALRYE